MNYILCVNMLGFYSDIHSYYNIIVSFSIMHNIIMHKTRYKYLIVYSIV